MFRKLIRILCFSTIVVFCLTAADCSYCDTQKMKCVEGVGCPSCGDGVKLGGDCKLPTKTPKPNVTATARPEPTGTSVPTATPMVCPTPNDQFKPTNAHKKCGNNCCLGNQDCCDGQCLYPGVGLTCCKGKTVCSTSALRHCCGDKCCGSLETCCGGEKCCGYNQFCQADLELFTYQALEYNCVDECPKDEPACGAICCFSAVFECVSREVDGQSVPTCMTKCRQGEFRCGPNKTCCGGKPIFWSDEHENEISTTKCYEEEGICRAAWCPSGTRPCGKTCCPNAYQCKNNECGG